jgi:hypothetical protein
MIQSTHPYPTCILIHLLMDAMRGVEMGKKNASGPDTLNAPLWIRLRDAYRNAPIRSQHAMAKSPTSTGEREKIAVDQLKVCAPCWSVTVREQFIEFLLLATRKSANVW